MNENCKLYFYEVIENMVVCIWEQNPFIVYGHTCYGLPFIISVCFLVHFLKLHLHFPREIKPFFIQESLGTKK